jgi:hypothetical protein
MDVLNVTKSFGDWLITHFTIHNFLIRKVCFKNPKVASLVTIRRPLFLYLKPIIKFNQINQIQMGFRNQILKEDWKLFVLVTKFNIKHIQLASNNIDFMYTWLIWFLTWLQEVDRALLL